MPPQTLHVALTVLNSLLKNVLLTMECPIHTMNSSGCKVFMLVYTGFTHPMTTLNLRTVWHNLRAAIVQQHPVFLNLLLLLPQIVGRHQKSRQQVADRQALFHNQRTPRPLIPHRDRNIFLLNRCRRLGNLNTVAMTATMTTARLT